MSKIKATDDVDKSEEERDVGKCSSDRHYEKLNKLDDSPQYAEIFPPNMQNILKEIGLISAKNILEFSRMEMERRSEEDDDLHWWTVMAMIHLSISN